MTPARFRWGTILITIGVLLLLRNIDSINDDVWLELLVYFPVVLIAIGIEKIFTKSRLQFLSYATSVALMGVAFWIAAENGTAGGQGSYFDNTSHRIRFDPDVKSVKAELDLNQTALTIRDSGSDIAYAQFDRFTRKPAISYRVWNDTAQLTFKARSASYLGGAIRIDPGNEQGWYVRFSGDIPLDLQCTGEETDIHMNLATTPLRSLTVDADKTSIYLKLGDLMPQATIRIFGADASLKLRVPEGIGLRIVGEGYESYLSRLGLIEDEGDLITEGYDTLPTRIEVDLDDRLSSFSLDYF